MSIKGLAIGILIGLVVGLGIGYAITYKGAGAVELEQKVRDLEGKLNTLQGQMDNLENITNVIELTMQEPPSFAYDGFLQIDGIPGESADPAHEGWIEIISFSHNMSRPAEAQKSKHYDFIVLKEIDKSSPLLYEALNTGSNISEVKLELCTENVTFATYTLRNVKVTSVRILSLEEALSTFGNRRHNPLAMEEISFSYDQILWEYIPISESGEPEASVSAGWDVTEDKPITPTP